MKRWSWIAGGVGFFAMAAVGALSGVPALTCAVRALAGAAALFVLVRLASGVVIRAIVDTVIDAQANGRGGEAGRTERTNE